MPFKDQAKAAASRRAANYECQLARLLLRCAFLLRDGEVSRDQFHRIMLHLLAVHDRSPHPTPRLLEDPMVRMLVSKTE